MSKNNTTVEVTEVEEVKGPSKASRFLSKTGRGLRTVGTAVVKTDLSDVGHGVAVAAKATVSPATNVKAKAHNYRLYRASKVLAAEYAPAESQI